MKLKRVLLVVTVVLLVACTSAPTVTPALAPPVTVSTAATPTLIPTPTGTATPTVTPTPTGTATPTVTPTPNFSSAILTIDDLPSGFQPASPADMARLNLSEAFFTKVFSSLSEGRPRNLFVFLREAPSYEQVTGVLIYPLSPLDAALIDSQIANPDSLIKAAGTWVSSGGSGRVRSSNTILGADKLGDRSIGVSLVTSSTTAQLRWDVVLAHRSAFAELVYLVYIDGRQPSTTIANLAHILDGRVAFALGSK